MSTLQVTNIQSNAVNTPPNIYDSVNTEVGTFCRAWVNFNSIGTVEIRGAFNVSSITDNGTGAYVVNFTNVFSDANYSVVTSGGHPSTRPNLVSCPGQQSIGQNAANVAVTVMNTGSILYDAPWISISIFK